MCPHVCHVRGQFQVQLPTLSGYVARQYAHGNIRRTQGTPELDFTSPGPLFTLQVLIQGGHLPELPPSVR